MQKIKILNWSLIIFITLGTIGILANMYYFFIYKELFKTMSQSGSFGLLSFSIGSALSCALLFGLYQIQQACSSFLNISYFNSRSALFLKRGGIILILVGVLCGLNNLFIKHTSFQDLIPNYMMYLMVIAIGIGLMAISDIVIKGTIIQEENDLTL